jgi:LysR family pca operon transcriptional activator
MTVRRGAETGEGARLLIEAIRRIVGRRVAAGPGI